MSEVLTSKNSTDIKPKAHSWRRCPIGKHFVKSHLEHIPPSKTHPQGKVTTRHEHCADNPSHKDELSYDEIQYITETHFGTLPGPPTAGLLIKEYPTSDDFKGELYDYLVRIPWDKILDPTSNICMGIRWLFQKKKLASVRLKRTASWEEAVIEYKSYWDEINAGKIPRGLAKFRKFYEILQSEQSK